MIRSWLRARREHLATQREKIAVNAHIAERTEQELQRVKAQRPRVEAHRAFAVRQLQINHVGEAVVAMIHRGRA